MGLTVNSSGQEIELIPAGVSQGVCYSVVDLGSMENTTYHKMYRKVLITFEVPEYTIDTDDGVKPRVVSTQYTASLSESSYLRRDLESWRGKPFTEEELQGFDLSKLVMANCQLNIVHNSKGGKIYANIASIMPLAKTMTRLKPVNPTVNYDIDQDGTNIPDSIPEWLETKIKGSPEYQALGTPPAEDQPHDGAGIPEDEIPF